MVFVFIDTLLVCMVFFFLMIRLPPRSTLDRSSAASDVYKRQEHDRVGLPIAWCQAGFGVTGGRAVPQPDHGRGTDLSLIHISEPTRPY